FVGPFEIIKKVGHVAYQLDFPEELNGVEDTFHVSNLKKCLADPTLQMLLDEIRVDAKLNFMEEPAGILDREFKKLKRSRIAIVKVLIDMGTSQSVSLQELSLCETLLVFEAVILTDPQEAPRGNLVRLGSRLTLVGDLDRPVLVEETFHKQTDEELTEQEVKEKAKLFSEWERFTSTDEESIESYYHCFSKLMNDFKRNKHVPEKISSNLKFLNNLQPEWSRLVTMVHQTKDLYIADYTKLYDFLKYNQVETILMGLPEDIYVVFDSCETAQEIWLCVQQMMKRYDIGIQEKRLSCLVNGKVSLLQNGQSEHHYGRIHQARGIKSSKRKKVFNWETAKYGRILYDEDVHDLRSVENEFPAIVFNDSLTSNETFSFKPTQGDLEGAIEVRSKILGT
nr:reverse transcriptase domain-containing protein [Tanacetum cinerariifolium]